jgi:hypothetical protein
MEIDMTSNDRTPFYFRAYISSSEERKFIDKELNRLIVLDINEYDKSAFVSPMMLIKKRADVMF